MKPTTAFSLLILSFALAYVDSKLTKHYVVYMGEHSHPNLDAVISANHEMLTSIVGSIDEAKQAVIHHYGKSFRGFSAMLLPEQASKIAEMEEVVSVFESKTNIVHTTHSWDFLGVSASEEYTSMAPYLGSDVIVGSIDTGVWPESKSFKDEGLGPVPKKFKGECVTGDNFTLANYNRKIIGARFYYKGFEADHGPLESFGTVFFRSARDSDGHGTHTASTVAGSIVENVGLFGMAQGTARGGVPGARLAIYKACWFNLCNDDDILLAFDDATSDGVDIISISAGPGPPQRSFFDDAYSIGAYHAFKKGILTSASAGNDFFPRTAINVAPWILTVAASSIDREFESNVTLGNSKVLKGKSLNPLKLEGFYNIIPGSSAAAPGVPSRSASFCKRNTLDPAMVKGKIVVCMIETINDDRTAKSVTVRDAGGVGMILIDPVRVDGGFQFVIPATLLGSQDANELQSYLASAKNPIATIARTETILHTRPAPKMAVFSSMGPNIRTPDIIKPDITAPGLNILAAWSPVAKGDTAQRSVNYNIISGTSMSCPHVSAVAAIIKSHYPYWSPAAIKSAMMTSATVLDNTNSIILRDPSGSSTSPFDYGSGHIDPIAALDPGLIYDHDYMDIINLLCSTGASSAQLRNLTGEPVTCRSPPILPYNFNYPSIGISNLTGSISVYRTVTYYGQGQAVYNASVESPSGVNVSVTPYELKFNGAGQKMTYRVDFKPFKNSNGSFVFGAIKWIDGKHVVRSPIAVNVVSV